MRQSGLGDRVWSSVVWEGLGVKPLLLCVERSQLLWIGHLFRTHPGFSGHGQLGGDLRADPLHTGRIMYLSWLRNGLGMHQEWTRLEKGVSGLPCLLSQQPGQCYTTGYSCLQVQL